MRPACDHLVAATWMIATASACRSDKHRLPTGASPSGSTSVRRSGIRRAIPAMPSRCCRPTVPGRLRVRGVSVTFGNVPLVRGYPAAQELLQRLDSGLLRAWRGASVPEERAAPTEATELLEEALGKEPLTIVATGPATTIASVLLRQPAMASRIERVILVAGTPRRRHDAWRRQHGDGGRQRRGRRRQPAGAARQPGGPHAGVPEPCRWCGPGRCRPGPPRRGTRTDQADHAVGARVAADGRRRGRRDSVRRAGHARGGRGGPSRAKSAVRRPWRPIAGPHGPRLLVTSRGPGRRVTWCHTADPGAKARMIADVLRVRPLAR